MAKKKVAVTKPKPSAPKKSKAKPAKTSRIRAKAASVPQTKTKVISDDEALAQIFALIHKELQLDISSYKLTTVRRRIARQVKLNKLENFGQLAQLLSKKPQMLKLLYEDIFIHVTEFFRDTDTFKALKNYVFPRLIKHRIPGAPLRIWIPGCATGEEAYSIAIALLEFLETQPENVSFQIFGTDISEPTVQKARAGLYQASQIERIPKPLVEKYFNQVKEGYKINKSIRDCCVFSRHDVTSNPPFAKIDLISCRNVLIYFAPALQQHVMPIFHYALNNHGFLWLGKSEAPTGIAKLFTLADKSNKIYSKIQTAHPISFRFPTNRYVAEKFDQPKKFYETQNLNLDYQKEVDRIVMARYVPAGAVINSDIEIIQLRGYTAPYLELPSGRPNYNLFKLLRPDLLPSVRITVQSAIKQNAPLRKENVTYEHERKHKKINIEVLPINPRAQLKERQYLVLFEDCLVETGNGKTQKSNPQKSTKKGSKPSAKIAETQDHYINELLSELDTIREYQQSLSEGYESYQEELTSSNEELQSALEEYQSTNEELETAKEELQASNEELTTVNDELQHRNNELSAVNEKLALSEERFRLMARSVKDYALYMLDPEGMINTWNEGARRLEGYEAYEVLGQNFSKFYPIEEIKSGKPEKDLEIARRDGRFEDESVRIRKDGSSFYASVVINAIRDDEGNLRGFAQITRDVSERRAAEQALAESEQRYRTMVNAVRDYAIYRVDPNGIIMTWNEGAKNLKGYREDEIIGKHFSVFYTKQDIENGMPAYEVHQAIKLGKIHDEGWRIRKDGTKFWASITLTAILDSEGNVKGFTKVTRDLTERKAAEEKLRLSNVNLEKRVKERTEDLQIALNIRDEFLSIASHELKTPLTSLKLQLQIIQKYHRPGHVDKFTPEQYAKSLELALRQVTSLTDLVEDLLDISRIQTGKLILLQEELDLSELVQDIVMRFSDQLRTSQNDVIQDLQPQLIGQWDRHRLEQVMINLISNVIKYAPRSPITIATKANDQVAQLIVSDHGPGIPKDQQLKIFERFERANVTKNVSGLGLGLFIVRKIVDAHQGSIHVQSDLGQGTTFTISLPFRPNINDHQLSQE